MHSHALGHRPCASDQSFGLAGCVLFSPFLLRALLLLFVAGLLTACDDAEPVLPQSDTELASDTELTELEEETSAGCGSDSDCNSAAPRCLLSTGTCVQCLDDVDCDGGKCSGLGVCRYGCDSDADCAPPTPSCNTASGVCEVCAIDADCPVDNPHCTDGTCVQCVASTDCESGACVDHACIAACTSDAQCAPRACDQERGRCVECTRDEHCTESSNGAHCSSLNLCVSCTADEHCAASSIGAYCQLGWGSCVACLDSSHCSPGWTCDFYRCKAPCESDADCASPRPVCHSTAKLCVECENDAQCQGWFCDQEERDCDECLLDEHCSPGKTCSADHWCR
ncbi:MAG: hypothetical protein RBU37_06550 [Myxococcota bacterium]|jgi:hypothetical protein|nr:hypothetical protein [Myxococcota bacterium]